MRVWSNEAARAAIADEQRKACELALAGERLELLVTLRRRAELLVTLRQRAASLTVL